MLKPPSDYQLTKVNLTSHSAKIDNLVFDTAVIFFVPKVADKGVDLTGLVCTIVQIIDRGEWGKEEVSFTVDASSISNRKHREFDLTADAPYSLKIIPPNELRMGILEIYFDPDHSNHSAIHLPLMGVSNPASSDVAAIQAAFTAAIPQMAQAIGTQSGAAMQQAMTNQAAIMETKNSNTIPFTVQAWSGDIKKHLVLPANAARMGVHMMHPGKNFSPTNISDVFVAVGSPAGRDVNKWDYVMNALGDYNSDPERETLPVYAWLAASKPDTVITVTEYLP